MRKLLLGLIGLLFAVPAVAATLPAGYTELEYIESTGTQYINTGLKQQDGDEFGLVYQHTALDKKYRNLFGASSAGQDKTLYISQTSSVTYVGNTSNNGIPHNTNKHTLSWVTTSSSSQNIVVDGQTYVVSVHITPNPNLNVMVFARNADQDKMIGKVYGYYQKRNGEYLINLVPAKNSSGVVGMYDLVSEQFFTNAGTGEFIASPEVSIRIATTAYNSARFSPVVTELNNTIATIRSVVTNTINQTKAIADLQATKQTRPDETCPAGKKCLLVEDNDGMPHWYEIIESASRLPDGYTELQYIESTGTQYIDTGFVPTKNTKIEIHNIQKVSDTSFGVASQIYTFCISGTNYYSFGSEPNAGTYTGVNLVNLDATIVMSKDDGLVINGQRVVAFSNVNDFTTDLTFWLFARNNTTPNYKMGAQRTYYFKMWDNGTLVRNLIPARRNSDSVLGMYDTVNDVFYTNAGTGTFVEGPAVQ